MWELIRANRRKSALLIILMGIVLMCLGFAIGMFYDNSLNGGIGGTLVAIALWLLLLMISFVGGKDIMLSTSNAREVTPDLHPQLYNVVEEMQIAAGLSHTPKVYIIDCEMPNAFATGLKPENSAIAVTSGLLSRLNRDELQGVVAHEMSHIINRDIRFMTIAGVMMGAVVLISRIFVTSLFFGGGSRRGSKGGGNAIMLLISLAFAILAPIAAQLLYFAISRKREYLADASAVRLTRYPEGLASALEKISASEAPMPSANKVTAPMYICNPLKREGKKVSDLSSTHPPISERVRILRAMSGGANYINYQQAYSSVRHKPNIIPASGLSDNTDIPLREGMGLAPSAGLNEVKTNTRKAGDVILGLNDYKIIECSCGLKLKVPPQYKGKYVYCTRCGKDHRVDTAS